MTSTPPLDPAPAGPKHDLDPERSRGRSHIERRGRAGHRIGRRLLAAVTIGVAGFLIAVGASGGRALAAPDDGLVQPGDRFGENYCAVGPVFERFVFSPKHCGWLGALGDAATVDGAASAAENIKSANVHDWRYSILEQAPRTMTTWTDCPSIRDTEDDPLVAAPCQTAGEDLAFAGVIQPWRGLAITKSGPTTGTTTGIASNSPLDPLDPAADGTVDVWNMYVCKGDSGSVAYAQIDGAIYLTGMVVGGWGSLALDQRLDTYGDNEKACYRTTTDPNYGVVIGIEQLCAKLPSPERDVCLNEAGTPRGEISVRSEGDGRATVTAIGFDPDTAGSGPLTAVSAIIDQQPLRPNPTLRPDAGRFGLAPDQQWGVDASIVGLGDGIHRVCVVFHNEQGTVGTDVERCESLPICHGAQADHTIVGSSQDERLLATAGRDLMIGGGGDDVPVGLGDEDCFFGGAADELLASSPPPRQPTPAPTTGHDTARAIACSGPATSDGRAQSLAAAIQSLVATVLTLTGGCV